MMPWRRATASSPACSAAISRSLSTTAWSIPARSTSPCEPVVLMRPGDLVMVLSFPPYSRQSLDLLARCAERGIATVAVTDRPTAPAARQADFALVVKSDNMMFTNAVAAVTVFLNALATEIATSHREHAVEAPFDRVVPGPVGHSLLGPVVEAADVEAVAQPSHGTGGASSACLRVA